MVYRFFENMKVPNWSEMELKPVKNNFYLLSEAVKNRSQGDVDNYRQTNKINVIGDNVPKPFISLDDTCFPNNLIQPLKDADIKEVTPLQSQGWPIALSGRDVCVVDDENSGPQTVLSYLLPVIIHVNHQTQQQPIKTGEGPIAVILVANRGKAVQVEKTLAQYYPSQQFCVLTHGKKEEEMVEKLKSGVEILITTLHSFCQYLSKEHINLHRCTYLIVDRADQHIYLRYNGYFPVGDIAKQIRPDCQIGIYSKYYNSNVVLFSKLCKPDHIKLFIGEKYLNKKGDILPSDFHRIEMMSDDKRKLGILRRKLYHWFKDAKDENIKILILVNGTSEDMIQNTQDAVKKGNDLIKQLSEKYPKISFVHAELTPNVIEEKLNDFRNGNFDILISTDNIVENMNFGNINYLVNYDFPAEFHTFETRASFACKLSASSIQTFLTKADSKHYDEFAKYLEIADQKVPKRLKNTMDSEDNEDEQRHKEQELIDEVKEHPELWDNKHDKFKDYEHKDSIWTDIANKLGNESGEETRIKWGEIRRSYSRQRDLRDRISFVKSMYFPRRQPKRFRRNIRGSSQSNKELDSFLKKLASSLRRLSPHLQIQATQEINAVILKYNSSLDSQITNEISNLNIN